MNMLPEEYLTKAEKLVGTARPFALTDELSDGRVVFLQSRPLRSGWVSTHEDITERRRAEAALAFLACHDALTELPNRTLFQERLVQAIATAHPGSHCALLCLDLDHFKVVNDTLGHPVGDGLLRLVAKRLASSVRGGDTVARLGGDEFAIILVDLQSPEHAATLTERLVRTLHEPYDIDGHRIMAGISIGLSLAPGDGTLCDTLMKNADIALYLAKAEGRGTYRFFEPEVDSYVQQRRALELDLRNAVPDEDFILHYQPILDLGSGRVTGCEALIRWRHPCRGMISPADFVPIAEETGLIIPIGSWAIQKACLEAVGWPVEIEISVNLSPVQFRRGHLLEVVREALATSGLVPHRLELEITESTLLENSGDNLALLHQLRALGIRIALDDFGTGYSSLSYLRRFPFDKIKIDRSFIRDVDTKRDSAVIVAAVVAIARGLGMTTVAEGVETTQQLATVRDQGCTKVQGYLLSRPCPAGEIPTLIRTLRLPEGVGALDRPKVKWPQTQIAVQ
jgi:diguanylate cyclase (GGDEF)-like protein